MRKVHIALCVFISAAFIVLGATVFSASYVRFWEAVSDMGMSVAVYFCEIFSISYTFTATFLQPSSVFGWVDYLPENYDGFKQVCWRVPRKRGKGAYPHSSPVIYPVLRRAVALPQGEQKAQL